MSDTLTHVRSLWLAPSSRDRISVDLRGLKAALVAHSAGQGVSPSAFVRGVLETALHATDLQSVAAPQGDRELRTKDRVRLTLRMQPSDREAVLRAAQDTGLPAGDFVAALVCKAPVLFSSARPAAHLAALIASCAELATLSRNLHFHATLLRQGSSRAAQAYREMLDNVDADVRTHLALATSVVAELQPLIRSMRRRETVATQ